jgi:hypothetical protein
MGYELRMHIHDEPDVDYFTSENDPTIRHGIEVAVVDLCKIGYYGRMVDLIDKARKENKLFGSFYATDGDTMVERDRYNDKLARIPGVDVLRVLREEMGGEEKYRRFQIAEATLAAVLDTFEKDRIYCYFFGH